MNLEIEAKLKTLDLAYLCGTPEKKKEIRKTYFKIIKILEEAITKVKTINAGEARESGDDSEPPF